MTPAPAGAPLPTRRRTGALAIAGAGVCFGTTFALTRRALVGVGPAPFLAVRFSLAALLLAPLALRRPSSPGVLRDGVAAGLALLAGYLLQTWGLTSVTGPVSAFETNLLVVIVPLLSALVLRRRPSTASLLGAGLATVGLWLLTGGVTGFGLGDGLTVGCAVAFAANIVVLGRVAPRHDSLRLTAVQLAVVAGGAWLVAGAAALDPGVASSLGSGTHPLGSGGFAFGAGALVAVGATAVLGSMVAYGLQTWGQRRVEPSRTAILLLAEPVTAALVGLVLGDTLSPTGLAGAGVILVAIVLSELGSDRARPPEPDPGTSSGTGAGARPCSPG